MTLSNEIVLVVDDDPLQLAIVEDDLLNMGAGQVLTASSGFDAIEMLKQGRVGVTTLLIDICMPEMDGPQLLRHLAEIACTARIFLVSGVSDDHLESISQLGLSHGLRLVGSIAKPVAPDELKGLLMQCNPALHAATAGKGAAVEVDLTQSRLETALNRAEIHPWYQPKVDARRMHLVGVEALARWHLPDGTLVGPGQFVSALESLGMFDELFFCIFAQVLADIRRWNQQGRVFKTSVNLSMDCAFKLDLPERMKAVTSEYGIAPDQIVIEVTESRLMENRSAAIETLNRISLAGFHLSMDDFGTGYSSLSQIAALPFNELKADGSFVKRACFDKKARAIVFSTVTLGRSLDMEVVAEGVETIEQLDLLRGCETSTIQGFLVARPMPREQFEQWLADWRPGLPGQAGSARPFALLEVNARSAGVTEISTEMCGRFSDMQVLTAASLQEALMVSERQWVDAVILEANVHDPESLGLLQQLRGRFPAARFVVLMSEATHAVMPRGVSADVLCCPHPANPPQVVRIADFLQGV